MKSKILLILGHPSVTSFSAALLMAYRKGAEQRGAVCKTLLISKMSFNPNLEEGYKNREETKLEQDLLEAQQLILWADHIVFAYPTWWGSLPALTKVLLTVFFCPVSLINITRGKHFRKNY